MFNIKSIISSALTLLISSVSDLRTLIIRHLMIPFRTIERGAPRALIVN